MIKLRNELIEEVSNQEETLQIQIDGNFQFKDLKIKENISVENLEKEIPMLINSAFQKMGERVKIEFEQLSTKPHLN